LKDDSIVNAVVALIGIGLVAVGIVAIAAPEIAAVMFGVPTQAIEARAYIRATATRDIAIGFWFLVLLGIGMRGRALGASLTVVALIPLGDFINVYSNARTSTIALLLHGGSTVAFLVFGIWLWRAR